MSVCLFDFHININDCLYQMHVVHHKHYVRDDRQLAIQCDNDGGGHNWNYQGVFVS